MIRQQLWQQLWFCTAQLKRELQESPEELCWHRREPEPPPLISSAVQVESPREDSYKLSVPDTQNTPDTTTPLAYYPEAETKSPKPAAAQIAVFPTHGKSWQEAISHCQSCGLGREASRIRQQAVIGYPPQIQQAKLLLVCDAPNYEADGQGLPLPQKDLEYLQKWLKAIQMADSYYLTNLVKCRTPGNRAAWPEEIKSCAIHLQQQLEVWRPQAILALGSSAARSLSQQRSDLNTLRSRELYYNWGRDKLRLFATYSVAEVLRAQELRAPVWQDLQNLRAYLQRNEL